MIDGFKFHVTSSEIVKHFVTRAAHHDAKASEAESRLGSLVQARDLLKAQPNIGNTMAYGDTHDVIEKAGKVLRYHRSKAEAFRFLAEHVPAQEIFKVDGGHLAEYEFVPTRPYCMNDDE